MKKLFVSVGLIAAGTAGFQSAYAADAMAKPAPKVWNASLTLRGFYDDNYLTAADATGSAGLEASPQVGVNLALQQTTLGARYTLGTYYYFERANLDQDPWDFTHQFDLWLDHAFTERWQASVSDSFVVGQEPELIDPGTSLVTRSDGNNMRNTANLSVNTVWTRLFSTQLGYGNTFYDYENSGATEANFPTEGASLAGLMNRMEQSVSLDFQWKVAPETLAFFGGMYGVANYTGDEPIAQYGPGPTDFYYSDIRNSRSYFGYVGVQRSMLANLSFNGRIGVQYTDNYNDPANSTSLNPYADLSLIYTYLPGSYLQFGFTQTQNATDQTGLDISNGSIAMYTDSSTTYASLNHKLTPKLMGTLLGRWQHSIYSGGFYDGTADNYYSMGLNFSYSFTPHFSAEAGYNLDYVNSDVPNNGYTRNRIYLGVSATY